MGTDLDDEIPERPQEAMPLLGVGDRVNGFPEVELGYTKEQALREASRCLRCDIQVEEAMDEPSLAEIARAQ